MAERQAELALQGDPAVAHDILARVWLARGDIPRAEKEAHLALEDRDRVFALLTLGKIEMQRKNYPGALAWGDRAVAVLERHHGTGVKGVYYLRGDALARMDRYDEAETAFRKEVEMFPRDPDAYKNLMLLYVTEGKNEQATALVFDLIKRSPTPPAYIAVVTTLRTVGDVNGARYWTIKALQQFPDDPSLRKLARG